MKSYEELKQRIDQRGVHAVFGDAGEGWGIEQNAEELAAFLAFMQQLGVTSVLEIGTGYRAGLARFLHDEMGWRVTTVDVRDYGHSYEGIQFRVMGQRREMSSYYFADADLVFIDGDHAYEAVKRDHALWGNFATKIVAFHDIAGLRECEGAQSYWREIAYRDTGMHLPYWGKQVPVILEGDFKPGYYEIIANSDQRSGIGYIVLAEVAAVEAEPNPPMKAPAKK